MALWLISYRKKWLRPDVVAGLTTAAVVIPKAMAYATIAGLPVQVGLYTAFLPMVIYAVLGTSRVLSVSTTTTLAVLTAAELGEVVPSGDPAALLTSAATLTLLVGMMLVLAAVLRLGFVANFISEPVLIGFKARIYERRLSSVTPGALASDKPGTARQNSAKQGGITGISHVPSSRGKSSHRCASKAACPSVMSSLCTRKAQAQRRQVNMMTSPDVPTGHRNRGGSSSGILRVYVIAVRPRERWRSRPNSAREYRTLKAFRTFGLQAYGELRSGGNPSDGQCTRRLPQTLAAPNQSDRFDGRRGAQAQWSQPMCQTNRHACLLARLSSTS